MQANDLIPVASHMQVLVSAVAKHRRSVVTAVGLVADDVGTPEARYGNDIDFKQWLPPRHNEHPEI